MYRVEILVYLLILLIQLVKLILLFTVLHITICNRASLNINVFSCFKSMYTEMAENCSKIPESPLCVFCLSPPFSIRAFTRPPERSASRRLSVRSWRRGDSSLFSVRPRFKPFNRRSCNSLAKYLSGFFTSRRCNTLTVQEVLEEIQKAWKPSCCSEKSFYTVRPMDVKRSSTSNEMLSPVLLRRRLSAPETIMRKHMLAQQRSDSQDSEITQSSGAKIYQWRGEMEAGSDTNLNRKQDPDLMRKATLLRRLWSHSKPLTSARFSGTFYEWQHSYGKLCSGRSTHSLTSIHSSPEHLGRLHDFRTSPQHKQMARKLSPKHQIYETNRQPSKRIVYNETSTTSTPKTETETSTRYTNTSYTTFSDNSDSAYTNSRFSESSNNNSTSTTTSEIRKQIVEDTDASNQDPNNSSVQVKESPKFAKYSANETATQTIGTTNVNVISNVQLSQSTLDLIFNQVMQDVNSQSSEVVEPSRDSESNIVQVKQIPSFYLKRKEGVDNNSRHSHIVKCMISNVGIGSHYTKPPEIPQIAVPRYSARPQTSSMEVNMSSGESTDRESDTVSLVDSLEDTSSLRTDPMPNETAVKSDVSLELPDNSDRRKTPSKPTAFFIPIEIEDSSGFKAVSDHLPDKVRNRLAKRQQKREEKLQNKSKQSSSRSDSNYISASDNGNHIHYIVDNSTDVNLNSVPLPEVNYGKSKKRSNKPLLPSIETFRKIKIDKNIKCDDKREQKTNKSVKRKSVKENSPETPFTNKAKSSHWIPKVKNTKEKLSPLYTSKNEYVYDYGPKRIYHKTEFNNSSKRIEILEIMECVDNTEKLMNQHFSKTKSKIPVLISHKLPKINQKSKLEKPTYLDLNNVQISDPKLDQLIANILIETLNIPDIQASVSGKSPEEEIRTFPETKFNDKRPNEHHSPKHSPSPSKYQQKFEAIPEELSMQSSTENNDVCNNNEMTNNNTTSPPNVKEKSSYQGKAAVAVVKDENFSSIPKGWITFYMLHNNRGSPDSTSDEGKKLDIDNSINERSNVDICKSNEMEIGRDNNNRNSYNNITFDVVKKEKCPYESNENCSSSSEIQAKNVLPPSNPNSRYKKYNHQRKQRHKINNETEKIKQFGEWSVTVSGTNAYGQFAPDLEMRLKFPDSQKTYNCPSQSDSGLGEENEHRSQFPKINIKNDKYKKVEEENEELFMKQRLPDIGRNRTVKKRISDSSVPSLGNLMSSRIEPRQTRTSTRRYILNRPKIDYNKDDTPRNAISIFDDSHYAEILKRFPEILSITGNSINQGKK